MRTKRLFLFLALVFGLGWLFQALAIRAGVAGDGRNWLLAAMWAPMLAALLTGRETRRRLWNGIRRSGWKIWPLALIAGWSYGIGQQLLLWAARQGHWNAEIFRLSGDGRSIGSVHHVAMMLGVAHQSFPLFAFNLVLTLAVASLILMLTGAIGEEGGWRGVLQPELEGRFGPFRGTLLVGLIWGFWHLPANLAGYNDTKHPILQALIVFQVFTIAMSFALAWLVRRSGGLWPAAAAHAANNVLQSGPLIVPGGWWADQLTAVLASILIGAIFCWLLVRRNPQTRRQNGTMDAGPENSVPPRL